jgi:hypothetical protein
MKVMSISLRFGQLALLYISINQFLALPSDFYILLHTNLGTQSWLTSVCMVASWNFYQVQFSLKTNLQSLLIFVSASDHAHYILYTCTVVLISRISFMDSSLYYQWKQRKLDPLKISSCYTCRPFSHSSCLPD